METRTKSDVPSKGVLDTIAESKCLFVMPIEPCAFAFSSYLVVLYLTLILSMVCMTSGFFKMELRRREQVREGDDPVDPSPSATGDDTGRQGSIVSRVMRPSIIDRAWKEPVHLSLKEPGVISILACFTMPVVFGMGNLYAILKRDVDFMGPSVVVLSLVIVIMAIMACPIAVQKRNVFSIIWVLVWICFNLYGALPLCSLYKQVRDEKPCRA